MVAKEEVACETLVKCTSSSLGKDPGRLPSTFHVVRSTSINLGPDAVGMKFSQYSERRMNKYTCMYVCTRMYVYVCMYVCTCMCVCMCVCVGYTCSVYFLYNMCSANILII